MLTLTHHYYVVEASIPCDEPCYFKVSKFDITKYTNLTFTSSNGQSSSDKKCPRGLDKKKRLHWHQKHSQGHSRFRYPSLMIIASIKICTILPSCTRMVIYTKLNTFFIFPQPKFQSYYKQANMQIILQFSIQKTENRPNTNIFSTTPIGKVIESSITLLVILPNHQLTT